MKNLLYKTRYIWVVLLAILTGLILLSLLSGCATWEQSTTKGECQIYAEETLKERNAQGLETIKVVGYRNGVKHMWLQDVKTKEIIDEFTDNWNYSGEYKPISVIKYCYKIVDVRDSSPLNKKEFK